MEAKSVLGIAMYGPNTWNRVLGVVFVSSTRLMEKNGELFWHHVGYHIGATIVLGFHWPMAYL